MIEPIINGEAWRARPFSMCWRKNQGKSPEKYTNISSKRSVGYLFINSSRNAVLARRQIHTFSAEGV
jgi:hypothetical protein